MAEIRTLFRDPNHLYLQELGWYIIQDYSKGPILKRYYINAISCQGIKYFHTPWTTQFIRTGLIQSTCVALAQLGHFIFHCVNSITQFKFQDGQNCISRFGQYSQLIHIPGSVFQFFTYTSHLSAPGDFFPS